MADDENINQSGQKDRQIGESVNVGQPDAHEGAHGNKEAVAGQYPESEAMRERLEGSYESDQEQDGYGRLDGQTTSSTRKS